MKTSPRNLLALLPLLLLMACFRTVSVPNDVTRPQDPGPQWYVVYTPATLVGDPCKLGPAITMQKFHITNRYIGQYPVTSGPTLDGEHMVMVASASLEKGCTAHAMFTYSGHPETDQHASLLWGLDCPDNSTCRISTRGAWRYGTAADIAELKRTAAN